MSKIIGQLEGEVYLCLTWRHLLAQFSPDSFPLLLFPPSLSPRSEEEKKGREEGRGTRNFGRVESGRTFAKQFSRKYLFRRINNRRGTRVPSRPIVHRCFGSATRWIVFTWLVSNHSNSLQRTGGVAKRVLDATLRKPVGHQSSFDRLPVQTLARHHDTLAAS